MAHIDPLARENLAEHEEGFQAIEKMMGFVPNSLFTMARVPGLVQGFLGLGNAVMANGLLTPQLSQMLAMMSSVGSGCRYCQAHTGHTAARMGVSPQKLEAMWTFETSDLFDDAERAALRIALHSGQQPNAATQADFDNASEHYSDEQVTAIVAVCAFFGYLNRWNDTMATTLEESPRSFGETVIATNGWTGARHA